MFLTYFRRISKGTLERSSTNLGSIRHVGTSLPNYFHAFSIPFRNPDAPLKRTSPISSSLLIEINSLRRNSNVFTSVIYNPFPLVFRYSNNRVLFCLCAFTMTGPGGNNRPSRRIRKHFYITSSRQKAPTSRENYASELRQVMILLLSRVGSTSCEQMVAYGRNHFMLFQNIVLLCMKN